MSVNGSSFYPVSQVRDLQSVLAPFLHSHSMCPPFSKYCVAKIQSLLNSFKWHDPSPRYHHLFPWDGLLTSLHPQQSEPFKIKLHYIFLCSQPSNSSLQQREEYPKFLPGPRWFGTWLHLPSSLTPLQPHSLRFCFLNSVSILLVLPSAYLSRSLHGLLPHLFKWHFFREIFSSHSI